MKIRRYASMPLAVQISGAGAPPPPPPDPAFGGDFSTLLSGLTVYSFWQPDRLLIEDTTLRQTSGSTAVLTLSGTRSGPPCAATVTCPTTGGARGTWQGLITFGDGSTLPFTSAATVSLAGTPLAGLTLNIATGTVATGNAWKVCAATLTDSVTSNHLTAFNSAGAPEIATVGGRATIATNGSTWVFNNAIDLPATPFSLIAVARRTAIPGTNGIMFGGDTGFNGSLRSLTSGVDQYNGSPGPANENAGFTAGAWGLVIATFTGSTADSLKFGAGLAVTGGNAGSTNPSAGRSLGALISGASGTPCEFAWGAWIGGGVPANIAAIKSAVTSWYNGQVPV